MCVVCVQVIARCQRELADPSISRGRRAGLERRVQVREDRIQHCKQRLVEAEAALATTAAALLHDTKGN